MSIVAKVNPVGIDIEIGFMQSKFYAHLLANAAWTNYESYPRAYVNESKGGKIPELYTGSNEYKECLMDDKFKATSFFLVDDRGVFNDKGKASMRVSMIFQADIKKLYPAVTHRADAEMHGDIYNAINDSQYRKFLTEIITGVENVYSDLSIPKDNLDRVKLDDMSNYHVVKANFTIPFDYKNC